MSERVLIQIVSEMARGTAPDVPLAPGVMLESLGDDPMFVTLRIGKVDGKSDKGFVYGEQVVRKIVNRVNQTKSEGRWGHIANEERHTKYEPPSLRWVGAMLDADGTAWGKALVLDDETREYYRVAEAAAAPVGTSIYGIATLSKDRKTVVDFDLESIDIADPTRLGVSELVGIPVITAEMSSQEGVMNLEEQLVAAIAERDDLQVRIGEMETTHAALQTDHEAIEGVRAVIGEYSESMVNIGLHINASGSDLRQVIQEMIERLQTMQAAEMVRTAQDAVGEMVTLENLRPLVAEMLHLPNPEQLSDKVVVGEMLKRAGGKPEDFKAVVGEQITRILESPSVKVVALALAKEAAGPSVVIGEQTEDKGFKDTEEARRAARERTGI